MALAWIEEQEDAEDAEDTFSPATPCRAATWEFLGARRPHDWMWTEEPVVTHRPSDTYQARLHHALADLRRITTELEELTRTAMRPVLEESLRAAIRQASMSLDLFSGDPAIEEPAAHELIDWRSANREQWSRGMTATVDEGGNPLTLIPKAAVLLHAVESEDEEPLLDE